MITNNDTMQCYGNDNCLLRYVPKLNMIIKRVFRSAKFLKICVRSITECSTHKVPVLFYNRTKVTFCLCYGGKTYIY